jgi:hypothetical protein
MTFKHTKFEDSPTMRSLVKVATQKGLIKEEILVKTASVVKQADYTPSGNLIVNILKLCSGLRDLGLEDNANELESKFLNYKQAQSIYETSKETGDDVIDMAHPDGSHRVSDVEGDAVVETILDRHIKMINVVNKKPTGKLASLSNNSAILNAVKMVVAQSATVPQLIASLQINAKGVLEAYNSVSSVTRTGTDLPEELVKEANSVNANNLNFDTLSSIYDKVQGIRSVLKPGVLNSINNLLNVGITESIWIQIEGKLNGVQSAVYKLQEYLKNPVKEDVKVDNDFIKRVNSDLKKLKLWLTIVSGDASNSQESKDAALKWISGKMGAINSLKQAYDNAAAIDQDGAVPIYFSKLLSLENKVNDSFDKFENDWIK